MFNILSGTKNTPTKESISQKADSALGMFNFAINALEESIIEADILAASNQNVIDTLTEENEYLESMTESNKKVIDKIRALIS